MNIIFLALTFPDVKKTSNLYTDLAEEFYKNNHNFLVIAPSLDNKTELKLEGDVKVLRVKTGKLFNTNLIIKGISNIMLPYLYKKAIKAHFKRLDFDLIILPTPPIMLLGVVSWLKRKTKSKVYLILRDIFPQNAVDLKLIKQNGLLHKFFRKKEKKLYEKADFIGCMSNANIDYVIKHNINISKPKVHLLPNWEKIKSSLILDDKEERLVIEKYSLENKFVAIFGGNLGKPQQLENIIELAEKVTYLNDVLFIIIGNGTEKEKIRKLVKEKHLSNVAIYDTIPKKEFTSLLNLCQIGLISLHSAFTIPNIPSKCLSYYNFKKPILASIDRHTDLDKILSHTKSGLFAYADEPDTLKENFLKLYNDRELRHELGKNGYTYLKSNLTPNHIYKIIKKNVS